MHGYLLYSTTTHGYLPYLYKFACELTVPCRTPKRAQTADHLLWTMSTHRWCVQIHGSSTVTEVSVETKLAIVRHSDQVLKSPAVEEVNTFTSTYFPWSICLQFLKMATGKTVMFDKTACHVICLWIRIIRVQTTRITLSRQRHSVGYWLQTAYYCLLML